MNTTIQTDFLNPSFTDTNLTTVLNATFTTSNQSTTAAVSPPPKSYNSRSFTSATLIPLLICGIFGIGSVGNALIIFVISKSKNLRQTATNIYSAFRILIFWSCYGIIMIHNFHILSKLWSIIHNFHILVIFRHNYES